MIDKSLAYRLSFYISLAVITVFVVFIIAYFLLNQRLLRENIENKAIGLNAQVNSLINRQVVSTKEVTENIALQFHYYSRHNYVEVLLPGIIKRYPYISSIQVVLKNTDGNTVKHYNLAYDEQTNLKYNESEEPLFSSPAEKINLMNLTLEDSAGWTDPFYDSAHDMVAVFYYHQLMTLDNYGNPVKTGHVISKYSLTSLPESLSGIIRPGSRGYAFIVDGTGNYLTHPQEERILKSNVTSLSSKIINYERHDLATMLAQGQRGTLIAYPEPLDYEKSWVHFSPIQETSWFLIYVIPHNELFGELYGVTLWMIIFALAGIVLLFSVIALTTSRLIAPLKNVTSQLTDFSNLNEGNEVQTKNEVTQVANSLEFLKNWFEGYQVAREKEELNSLEYRQDLHQASEIQQSLIKTSFPVFPKRKEVDLHAVYKPARVVSGDLFDFFFIDGDNLLLTIGDVSGKGVPAAIFMSVALTLIKNNAYLKYPRKIVKKTNAELYTSNQHQYFLTLFVGVLNVKTGVFEYCNAAHTFPYILKPDGRIEELSSTHGLPLGLYPEKGYLYDQVILEKDDMIILYTDGVSDVHNEHIIKENLKQLNGKTSKEVVDAINIILENSSQIDDVCLLAVKYMP
jgi:phosphoserine phosphatase RsbU/P